MALPNLLQRLANMLASIRTLESNLTTVSTTATTALSTANSKAPKAHAVDANTYGLGTSGVYGHVKLSDAINSTSAASAGIAATPKAVSDAITNAKNGATGQCVLKTGSTMTGALKVPTPAAGLNDTTVVTAQWVRREMLNIVYPVGSIYMSVSNVSPQTFLGGTWAALGGRFLFGVDSSHAVNSTGGAASHVITAGELPKHNHTASCNSTGKHTHTKGSINFRAEIINTDPGEPLTYSDKHTSKGWDTSKTAGGAFAMTQRKDVDNGYPAKAAQAKGAIYNGILLDSSKGSNFWNPKGVTGESGAHAHTISIGNAGSSTAMSLMPPYLAVYMWKRTK